MIQIIAPVIDIFMPCKLISLVTALLFLLGGFKSEVQHACLAV